MIPRHGETVDVILPTHDRPHTIAYAIASVLEQSHSDLLLHVVGDGCDPVTQSIVGSLRDPRVQFHRFAKGYGYGYAHRNVVLRESSAPYVAYATDDDLWFPDHLERALRELRGHDVDHVAFRSCHVTPPRRLDPFFFSFDWRRTAPSALLRNWFMGSTECVHRRSIFDAVGYWNEELRRFGDREFYNRVRRALGSRYLDVVTVMRFYADEWNGRYDSLAEPPQKGFLDELRRPEWRAQVREAAACERRSWGVRMRQVRDFVRFGVRYAPRFMRFGYQLLHTRRPPRIEEKQACS